MSKSDTPETDAAQIREAETRWGVEPQVWPLVRADFARNLERQRDELAEGMRRLIRAYVRTLENGRDRITLLGGYCDSVEQMERDDPELLKARAILARIEKEKR